MTERLKRIWTRIAAMFGQPSTWRGVVVVLTGVGVGLKPEHQEAIVAGGLTLAGLIAIVLEP